jgi:hypothetical protein
MERYKSEIRDNFRLFVELITIRLFWIRRSF